MEIRVRSRQTKVDDEKRGFTLIELLVVISIISLLMAILVPSLRKVRQQARAVVAAQNQKEIVSATTIFASDNNERFPESVATVGTANTWNWSDPTKLTGNKHRSPGIHRAMSEYLKSYIPDASTMYCPNAPQRYKYLQQAWDAGDDWDYPEDDTFSRDPVGGTYCFYWNYTGYVGGRKVVFKGPQGPASGGRKFSKLIVSDYFGYDHWRSPWSHGSCEQFEGAEINPETWLLSAYWFREGDIENPPDIELRAGYTDGTSKHIRPRTPF
ncbi:MAG: prepilin-type N-terminal cleavage/methylation domain-containing protein [Planctomycetaceae bacterium]|nr:MAG: prepilin-type N-terminal cleavage/methylation domain-containing protein [Planctomycetaceae bacterium]